MDIETLSLELQKLAKTVGSTDCNVNIVFKEHKSWHVSCGSRNVSANNCKDALKALINLFTSDLENKIAITQNQLDSYKKVLAGGLSVGN
jgi:hypothetical protein